MPGDHLLKAPDIQEKQNDSVLHHYRATLNFRRNHKALAEGTIRTFDAPEGVLMFSRELDGERVLCVYNMTANPVAVPYPQASSSAASTRPARLPAPLDGELSLPGSRRVHRRA